MKNRYILRFDELIDNEVMRGKIVAFATNLTVKMMFEVSSISLPYQNYRLIHDIYVLLDAGDRQVLNKFGLTPAQFRILMLLASQRDWRLIDLSQAMLCARSTITRIVDGMAANNWVERISDSRDRRAQRLRLTDAGASLLEQARDAHTQSLERRFGDVEEPSRVHLMSLLEHLRSRLLMDLNDIQASEADGFGERL
jgi:DNA-binding MarR family transcriptional regulator